MNYQKLNENRKAEMKNDRFIIGIGISLPFVFVLLNLWRRMIPERSLQATGFSALIDLLFSIVLLSFLFILSAGIGRKIISMGGSIPMVSEEKNLFAVILGFGLLGTIIFYLGIFGALTQLWIFGTLLLLAIITIPETGAFVSDLILGIKALSRKLQRWENKKKFLFGIILSIGFLCFLRAFAPPWDPDSLIYHLRAPQIYLQQGHISFLEGNDPANYPLLPEMVFLIGLVWKCDILARLVHLTFFFLLMVSTFLFARRFFNLRIAWLSLLVVLSMPILPFWGTLAYTDFCWAVFQFLSFYALLIFFEERRNLWLGIAGMAGGFAMGSKYLAIGGVAVLCLWAIWNGRKEWKKILIGMIGYGMISIVIAMPWYLKNIIASGNPFYPLNLGLPIKIGGVQTLWQEYMQNGFGTGRTIWDYLLLPWNLYAHHEKFATVGGTIEILGFLFPLAVFSAFIKDKKHLASLGIVLLGWFVFWAVGSQQIRFLLPLIPALCVLAAAGINYLLENAIHPRIWRAVGLGIAGGILMANLIYQINDTLATRPWLTDFGFESQEAFLRRTVTDFTAVQYAMENIAPTDKILFLWDGRGYYCDARCLPDTMHYRWTWMVGDNPPPEEVARTLRSGDITYLLLSISDLSFLLEHDPGNRQYDAWMYLENAFVPKCAQEVYRDPQNIVWEITCP